MSPELWWNHSKQDIQEQNLQSVVNGEKLTSTASNKLYWTNIRVWSSLNQNKYQKNILIVFDIVVTENTAFFHTGMGAWVHNFYVLSKYFFDIPYVIEEGWSIDFDWVESFALNLTNEKRSGNLPSFLSQRKKTSSHEKQGMLLLPNICDHQPRNPLQEQDFVIVSAGFLKCEKNIYTMMSAMGTFTKGVLLQWAKLNKNMCKNTFDIKIQSLLGANILLDFVFCFIFVLVELYQIRQLLLELLQTSPSKLLSQSTALVLFPTIIVTFIPSGKLNLKDFSLW